SRTKARERTKGQVVQGYFFLVFIVILGVLLMQTLLRRQQEDELRRIGIRVAATVTNLVHERVQTNLDAAAIPTTPTSSSVPPDPVYADHWYIECAWTEPHTGAVSTFRSDSIDETTAHVYLPGSPITVLMLPDDPDSYYVEVIQ